MYIHNYHSEQPYLENLKHVIVPIINVQNMIIMLMTVQVKYFIRQRYIIPRAQFSFNLHRVLETEAMEIRGGGNILKRSVNIPEEK